MVLYDAPLAFVLVYLFILGTVAGSFLNVCIYRLPNYEAVWPALKGLWSPPSRCPNCFRHILVRDNLPVIGWLKLRGRCRFCQTKFSARYPLVEFFNGLLFVLVYWMEVPAGWGATIDQSCAQCNLGPQGIIGSLFFSPVAIVNWRCLYHMILLEALVVATFIDFDLKIIPDGVTVPGMILGVLGGWAIGRVYLVPVWFQDPSIIRTLKSVLPDWTHVCLTDGFTPSWIVQSPHLHGLCVSVAGLIVGGGVIWAVRLIGFWVLRQEAMGFGDVTLMAMIGSFLGWQPVLIVSFLAPVCALVVVAISWAFRKQRAIPYGPYLSLAALIVVLGWRHIWPVAERFFSLGPVLPVLAIVMAVMLAASLLLLQGIKSLLGIDLYPPEWEEAWTSSDQLAHFAGENVDLYQGRWRSADWPGMLSGRGALQNETWRHG